MDHVSSILKIQMLLPYLLVFCRVAIGIVFVISFLSKVQDVPQFARTIDNFNLLPRPLSQLAALLFLSGELTVTVLVVIGGRFLSIAFILAALLLFIFTFALASVLSRNIETPCNCFGDGNNKMVSAYDVWRNAGLALCAAFGLGLCQNVDRVYLSLPEWGLAGVVSVVFVTAWMSLDDLIALLRTA